MRGGAPGYPRDAKGELFLLAVSNMVGEDTFYEASGARDSRFVADAAVRLYNERSLLKWDSVVRSVRFGDVLELSHPTPSAPWQGDLFRYAIDRRRGRSDAVPSSLSTLIARSVLMAVPVPERRTVLAWPERLAEAVSCSSGRRARR
jgi:hypothetical protein